jgi:hypothetical protein
VDGGPATRNEWATNWLLRRFTPLNCLASIILLFVISKMLGCYLRASDDDKLRGLDCKYFYEAEGDFLVLNGLGAITPEVLGLGGGSRSESHKEAPVVSEKRD